MIIIYILVTILIFGLLITVHEFGHFLAARFLKIKVEEFSIGMGPSIYQKEGKHTLFSVRALPLGGYCKLQEEQTGEGDQSNINPEESFINRPAWERFIVLIAGVTMNFLLGFILIYFAFLFYGLNPIEAFPRTTSTFLQSFGLIFLSIKMLFTGEAGINDLTGPIGIVSFVGEYLRLGIVYFLLFVAIISINLGICNLLPIPALDGGQIVILGVEKLKGSELSEKFKERLFFISYVLLLSLAIFIAINDISRFF